MLVLLVSSPAFELVNESTPTCLSVCSR